MSNTEDQKTTHWVVGSPLTSGLPSNVKVKIIGRTTAAWNAEKTMGSDKVEVQTADGRRYIVDNWRLRP